MLVLLISKHMIFLEQFGMNKYSWLLSKSCDYLYKTQIQSVQEVFDI